VGVYSWRLKGLRILASRKGQRTRRRGAALPFLVGVRSVPAVARSGRHPMEVTIAYDVYYQDCFPLRCRQHVA